MRTQIRTQLNKLKAQVFPEPKGAGTDAIREWVDAFRNWEEVLRKFEPDLPAPSSSQRINEAKGLVARGFTLKSPAFNKYAEGILDQFKDWQDPTEIINR